MEYIFNFSKNSKDPSIIKDVYLSIFFHIVFVIIIKIISTSHTEVTDLHVTVSTIQIHSPTSKPNISKKKDKVNPNSEALKADKKQYTPEKEIPAEKNKKKTENKEMSTPSAQSSNPSNEYYSAESTVDKTAQCTLPEINITDDAASAGVTSGSVVIEVQINSEGKVTNAKLIKGTGYKVDLVALEAAKLLSCRPASKEKQSVGVIKRLTWMIVP